MNRFVLALLLFPLAAAADTFSDGKVVVREEEAPAPSAPRVRDERDADFSRGAVIFSIQPGYAVWGLDLARIQRDTEVYDPGGARVFVDQANQAIGTVSVKLGYNILGHVTLDAELTGTGWNVFRSDRGGAGFLVGALHWHPLELVWRKEVRPVPFDASVFFGYGYGICGSTRGMDGNLWEVGVDASYFVSKSVGFGIFARGIYLNWDKFYQNFDGNQFTPMSPGLIGSMWTFGISLDFRFET